jgi:hypothetical protein
MEENNNVYCKFIYKCGICGTEHSSILDRAKCEIACVEKAEAEAKAAAEAQKKEEQKLRKEAVDDSVRNLHRLVTEYVKDYGHYEYGDSNNDGEYTNFYWPSRAWHRLW